VSKSSDSEAQIEIKILEYLSLALRSQGGFFWKNNTAGFYDGTRFRKHSSPYSINGTSDILGVFDGKFIALEVKALNGRASAQQKIFIEKIHSCGGHSAVVNSVEQVKELFEEWFPSISLG